MLPPLTIEERLAALEQAVAEMQQQIAPTSPPSRNWVEKLIGPIADEEGMTQVFEHGQAYRKGHPLPDVQGDQP